MAEKRKREKVQKSVTLDREVVQRLEQLADYELRSVSSYVNIILKRHIKEEEVQERLRELKGKE